MKDREALCDLLIDVLTDVLILESQIQKLRENVETATNNVFYELRERRDN